MIKIPTQLSEPATSKMPNEESSLTPISLLPRSQFQSTEDVQEESTNQVQNDSEDCNKKERNQIQNILTLALALLDEDYK
jgi:hypothetical protein